ncbi:TKL family protein kinase [Histomonas meleagridis]|uniref:TKL family protein kinase n=1 Tax=Histomonas meleagridis TaxID=135588 RepID=UPI00355A407C|nr:TKL family protein kinase [Histomonas meleagridis]KAH0804538.1 TKL family protein kinase [Histomonas meleagridis]
MSQQNSGDLNYYTPKTLYDLLELYPEYACYITNFNLSQQITEDPNLLTWTGTESKTGKQVFIRQVKASEFEGKEEIYYAREVYILARSNTHFVSPLVGYTVEPPYCIITEFSPNGNLRNYAFPQYEEQICTLSSTRKTIVALAICHAMKYLHSRHVAHRDLRTQTISMDKKMLPRINNLSSACICAPGRVLTSRVGTTIYMSPENLLSKDYGLPNDVYSFGMLLYEMAEEHPIYATSRIHDLPSAVQENPDMRPEFSKTSFSMRRLIKKCWSAKPENRPTFEKLFAKFAKGKYSFDGTKTSKVKAYAENLLKDDEKRAAEGKKKPNGRINIDKLLAKYEKEGKKEFLESNLYKNFSTRMKIQQVNANAQHVAEQQEKKEEKKEEPEEKKNEPEFKPIPKITLSAATRNVRIAQMNNQMSQVTLPNSIASPFATNNELTSTQQVSKPEFLTETTVQHKTFTPAELPKRRSNMDIFPEKKELKFRANYNYNASKLDFTKSVDEAGFNLNLDILLNTLHPQFNQYIIELAEKISSNFYEPFSDMCFHYINNSPEETVFTVFKAIVILCERDPAFLEIALKKRMFYNIPLDNLEHYDTIIRIYSILFKYKPRVISKDDRILSQMFFAIRYRPDEMINILSHFTLLNPSLSFAIVIYDKFLELSDVFASFNCSKFITLFLYLINNEKGFSKLRFSSVQEAFCIMQSSTDESCLRVVYKGLAYVYNEKCPLDFEAIINHLKNKNLSDSLYPLMLRVIAFPPSKRLCYELINLSMIDSKWTNVLLNFASSRVETASTFITLIDNWTKTGLPTYVHTYKLLLILFSYNSLRNDIIKSLNFPQMLTKFIETKNQFIIATITTILRRCNVDNELATKLEKANFIYTYLKYMYTETRADLLQSCIVFIDMFVRIINSSSYKMFIPKLTNMMSTNPELTPSIIQVLTLISNYKDCAPIMKQYGLDRYFRQLLNNPSYRGMAATFMQNIS